MVPIWTAAAPTNRNSRASSAFAMPPIPMTGSRLPRATSHTMRTAMGRIAGPDSPPTTFARRGRRVSTSTAIAGIVLMRDTASAPASATRRATAAMSLALGLSFGITGSRVPRRTTSVARAAMSGSQPNSIPPSATFGQEMFTSMADTPSAWSRIFDSSPYSSSELPQMFAMTIFPSARTAGSFSARNRRIPTS